jgi:hypothetical protein
MRKPGFAPAPYPFKIDWYKEQHERFGLDYTTKQGRFHDYVFDIRYDADTRNPEVKPDSGIVLSIRKGDGKFIHIFDRSLDYLVNYAEDWIKKEINQYKKYFVSEPENVCVSFLGNDTSNLP